MPDHRKSIPPTLSAELDDEARGLPFWERTAGFRESLLVQFPRREAKALRRVGQLLFYMVTEVDLPYAEGDDSRSLTRREAEAALMDLRAVQSFLAGIARQAEDSDLKRADLRLALAAGEASAALVVVLGALAEALR
jgi:hypothetical protein